MNGANHYHEAEQLLRDSYNYKRGGPAELGLFAEAQVHATLALAAAVGGLNLHAAEWQHIIDEGKS